MRLLNTITGWTAGIVACTLMFFVTACSNNEETADMTDSETEFVTESPQDNSSAELSKLNDAQIVSVVVVANQIDVNYGMIALEKSEDPQVLMFARMMINDHGEILNQALALAQKLGITPEESEITQSFLDEEIATTQKLEGFEGEEFNAAYIDNEVTYHAAIIDNLKNVLIPQTQNEELKQTLIKIIPLLEDHLKMMKEEQSKIEG